MFRVKPYHSHVYHLTFWHLYDIAVIAVGLPYLTLYMVAVNGMFEISLWHGNKQRITVVSTVIAIGGFIYHAISHAQWISKKRATVTWLEYLVYQIAAA